MIYYNEVCPKYQPGNGDGKKYCESLKYNRG